MNKEIREQILKVRDTGLTNMFDLAAVKTIAYELGFRELVTFLEKHRKEYVKFIITGDE